MKAIRVLTLAGVGLTAALFGFATLPRPSAAITPSAKVIESTPASTPAPAQSPQWIAPQPVTTPTIAYRDLNGREEQSHDD